MRRLLTILTLLGFILCSFAQNDVSGIYVAPWGSILNLKTDSTFDYESFECYHLTTAFGNWTIIDDTLRLTTTNKAGYDSIVNIEHSRIDFEGIRVTLTDLNANLGLFIPLVAFSNGNKIQLSTDTLGYVDFNLNTFDSLKIGSEPAILFNANKTEQNHITVAFRNINFMGTEDFDNRPYLARRRKLFVVFEDGINKDRYFKKE